MAKIKPFRGVRYNQDKVPMNEVVAPPYDVISPEQQDYLYKRSVYNIVRLILGREKSSDNETNNKYARACEFFKEWQEIGLLTKEDKEAIYIYRQDFMFDGVSYSRIGFLSLLKQEPLFEGTVYPHEKTLSKPKADRLNLTRACKANFSPIFVLYNDEKKKVNKVMEKATKENPEIDFLDDNNERNRLWKIRDKHDIKIITDSLECEKVFIADGHHRYETSMNYAKEMKEKGIKGNFDYVMAFFCDMTDIGLAVFPTHRVVRYDKLNLCEFLDKIEEYFSVRKYTGVNIGEELKEEFSKNNIAFGLYTGKYYYILSLSDKDSLKDLIEGSEYYRELDVAVLQSLVFEKILGFSKEDITHGKYIKYIKDLRETVDVIDKKKYNLAFIMNPTRLDQIKNVALSGETMPQKSTYFYPKLLTGMVINKLRIKN